MTVFTGMRYLFAGIPTRPFVILYIMHSFASFLRSDKDLHPNVWSIFVTLDVLWWRCKTYRAFARAEQKNQHKHVSEVYDDSK